MKTPFITVLASAAGWCVAFFTAPVVVTQSAPVRVPLSAPPVASVKVDAVPAAKAAQSVIERFADATGRSDPFTSAAKMLVVVDGIPYQGTLAELKSVMPNLDYFTVVVDRDSGHPRLGYVTDHLSPGQLNGGDVDVYVCGPPPMVEGVRSWMGGVGVTPKNFLFEKFSSANEAAAK